MGLKTKHASSNDHHQSETLKCPRCASTNTKFCYYNNYNKSQPRHFCKSCKRHWTKGGTLRTIPIGGVRKNKRPAPATTGRQDYRNSHFSTMGLYNVSAPLNPSTQYPILSSLSLNDDHVNYYYPVSSDSMEESSTITDVNIPSIISSGPWPGPDSMDWPNYWNWNEIDDGMLAGSDYLGTSWDDVFAEISNPEN